VPHEQWVLGFAGVFVQFNVLNIHLLDLKVAIRIDLKGRCARCKNDFFFGELSSNGSTIGSVFDSLNTGVLAVLDVFPPATSPSTGAAAVERFDDGV
jgi:hypothetical protein